MAGDFDFERVARLTPGFVGADLAALTKEAAANAVTRIFPTLESAPAAMTSAAQEDGAQHAAQPALATPASAGLRMHSVQPLSAAQLEGLAITAADFEAAVAKVQPSVRREGFATTPDVTWDDVGSLAEARCPS